MRRRWRLQPIRTYILRCCVLATVNQDAPPTPYLRAILHAKHPHGVIAGASRARLDDRQVWGGWLFPDRVRRRARDQTPDPSIERKTTMCEYIGLDVSLKETAISVRRDGQRVWRGKCPSDPGAIATVLRRQAPSAQRVVFETGALSVWFFHALPTEGLPVRGRGPAAPRRTKRSCPRHPALAGSLDRRLGSCCRTRAPGVAPCPP